MFNFVSERNKASMRHCAFCQNWYDPTNSVIRPKNGVGNWEYEHRIKKKCKLRGVDTPSNHVCNDFVQKTL